ncbi:hypothetical protein DWB85_06240 [Seongchinamella sediminis]|uniref:Uncharacterized protein n=1 Tax=Seongchinamella sediminis TaxID=2283635 RepID=A0A3L7E2W5_9GAMM|nr:hypothetical protein [Seongchinamella sediminis]RLQ22582.1 hypothetical protein DWB85_06240 [Seongchinamella sediminis]
MTEAEISFQISEYLNRIWTLQQWWASISIGVLVMAHLASKRLNLFLVLISLGLYTSYTLYMAQMSRVNIETVWALATDLEALIQSGAVNSNNARNIVAVKYSNPLLYYLTFPGTYLSVCAYLIYCYCKDRGDKSR